VLPGIVDLRRNILKKGHVVVFFDGARHPAATLTGNAFNGSSSAHARRA